ncbi:sensor histidine kinase [Mangrovimonas sp. DI 80]|uniref:sensor histidine kinase n=1 Tax=Mangrovimonas sp. DI 80 TaxID=1779330 RepID=UPI0009781AFD|nr:histidine kinase [Mangrovimonas sp. DI 80]OMP29713.1 histidine kinase [Mangrovimonas sp. DI 80]
MLQTAESIISTEAERYLLVYMIAVLVVISSLIIVFFIVFQKRKNKLVMDKIRQQQAFERELQNAQMEIQEETMKQVGRELHDNVAQLLTYANMQLKMLSSKVSGKTLERVQSTSDIVKESLNELRSLSKSLNNEVVLTLGLEESLSNEMKRLKRLKFKEVTINVEGERRFLKSDKHEIILFRILQEFFSNSVKYSKAQTLAVTLNYTSEELVIVALDDGKGFDGVTITKGSGLINMKSRAALVNTSFLLESKLGEGTRLTLKYPFQF